MRFEKLISAVSVDVDNDRHPNVRRDGILHLVHCFACGENNNPRLIPTGRCLCGWVDPESLRIRKERLKKRRECQTCKPT